VLALWIGIGLSGLFLYYASTLPDTSGLMAETRGAGITILDVQGRTVATRGASAGPFVQVEVLPPHVTAAVLAIEDRRFYGHFGIDVLGLGRAMVANLRAGTVVQGGSTITQQLAKNLFLTPERTFGRKIQETLLALWLEARFTKNEILSLYLNRVYFGGGAYGIDAAAQRYFGIHADALSLQQGAMLAGLLKAPSRYSPAANPEGAAARMQVVLAAMVDAGYLDPDARALSDDAPVAYSFATATDGSGYFVDWLMDRLPAYIGGAEGNLVVETSFDIDVQYAAERALSGSLDQYGAERNAHQGAAMVFDLAGGVVAMVGGRSYVDSQFNRATQARRQPGSAFKPFVYLAALEAGYRPDSVVLDEAIDVDGWSPANFTGEHEGFMQMNEAFAASVNTVAVRLTQSIGPAHVARTARRMGITTPLEEVPSIALGTVEVSPFELTSAYVPLANGGAGVIPHAITRIVTADGEVLFERTGSGPGRVIPARPTADLVSMMSLAIAEGTGRRAYLQDRPSAGKTGTSQDFRDAWFVGFTGDYVAGVWIGNDDNSPMARVTGGALPAQTWNTMMRDAHRGLPPRALAGRLPAQPAQASSDRLADAILRYDLELSGGN
jgi:penicillin-binding protein 1A